MTSLQSLAQELKTKTCKNDQKLVSMTDLLVRFLTISKKPFCYMFFIWGGDRLMTKGVASVIPTPI